MPGLAKPAPDGRQEPGPAWLSHSVYGWRSQDMHPALLDSTRRDAAEDAWPKHAPLGTHQLPFGLSGGRHTTTLT